jgi:hypothetical protein
MKYVIRVLLLTIFLLFAYGSVIQYYPQVLLESSSWTHQNRIRAEEYVFANSTDGVPLVVVGSSLSANLFATYPRERIANLSLSAYSAISGLELVMKRKTKPKVLLVEINYLQRDIAFQMNSRNPFKLGVPVLMTHFPAFRSVNEPFYRAELGLNQLCGLSTEHLPPPPDNPELRAKRVAGRLQELEVQPFDTAQFRWGINRLVEASRQLQQQGTRVIWFAMPFELESHSRIRYHNTIVERKAQKLSVPFIRSQGAPQVHTSDGLHLTPESMVIYEKWLVRQLDSLGVSRL